MYKVEISCQYCGHVWISYLTNHTDMEKLNCYNCKDTNLKVKELHETKRDVFGYNSQEPQEDAYIKRRKY